MRGVDILKCLLQLMHDASDANHFLRVEEAWGSDFGCVGSCWIGLGEVGLDRGGCALVRLDWGRVGFD